MKIFLQVSNSVSIMNIARYIIRLFCFMALSFPVHAIAAPSVAASIKPLHSLVSAVMDGIGKPFLIVQGAASEHSYQLRPADAQKLASMNLVFWVGPQMETFLIKPLENLSAQAEVIALSDTPGMHFLDMRDGGNFEKHQHAYEHGGQENHADLHFWLDPQNAKTMVRFIAAKLALKDTEHAALYHRNAEAYEQRLDNLIKETTNELLAFHKYPFIVFHDAYQYFEKRFGVNATGSITVNPVQVPGVKRIAEIHEKVKKLDSVCIFSEPQFPPRLVQTVIEGTYAKSGVLDPLGADLSEGPEQYIILIRNIAASLKSCFGS
ncbi:MAG: zinc transport system substrate-binding protein [Candidatus Tokpelaia sp. JSC189]|nr:MAG: zinc transport system substrate-binding protein [Candidatus Tokpelaia sp. JSC189]